MAMDQFIKIATIAGESKDSKHKDEIDVLAWSWGASNSSRAASEGGGGGSGKVNIQDISFTKYIDKASPLLFQAAFQGSHLTDATLVVRKAGGTPLEYLTIKMTDVMVSSVSTGGSGGEDRLTENVTLNFSKINLAYKEQDEKGAQKGGDVTAGWNIKENKKA